METEMMTLPPLEVMETLLADSRRLLNEGRPLIARGTLHLADFYLQVARFDEPPCGVECADRAEEDIRRLKEEADRLVAALPPEDVR